MIKFTLVAFQTLCVCVACVVVAATPIILAVALFMGVTQ